MHYIITGNTYRSGLFYQCGDQVVVIEKNIFKRHKFTTEDKLYVPCEGGLEMVLEQSGNIRHIGAVRTLKDKYEARKETQPMFPDFYFKKTNLEKVP
ncbi:MAG: hypothetical protein GY765_32595, partial [bacterium]|nr:hypothetical protein [bacterium]